MVWRFNDDLVRTDACNHVVHAETTPLKPALDPQYGRTVRDNSCLPTGAVGTRTFLPVPDDLRRRPRLVTRAEWAMLGWLPGLGLRFEIGWSLLAFRTDNNPSAQNRVLA